MTRRNTENSYIEYVVLLYTKLVMKRILVLYGGTSDERPISIKSGTAVEESLIALGYKVSTYDPQDGFSGLQTALSGIDLAFPVLHGRGGEDGVIQKMLEENNVPFVGAGSTASELCYDKWLYKQHLQKHQFLSPKGELVTENTIWNSPLTKQAFVLKPNDGGSSIDTFIVRDISTVDKQAIGNALTRHETMLLEELISGTETTVAVIGNTPLPMVEIIPPANEEFDYENKYNGATQELCPPQNVSEALQKEAAQLALDIHISTGCKDISRTDIIITEDGKLYVLETNTIPGMTKQSLVPKAAQAAGYSMDELIATLVA